MMRRALCLAIAAFGGATARAEDEVPFAPDRPRFADSTETVPAGRVQLELGARGSFEDGATIVTGPSILLRAGLSDFLEARVSAPDITLGIPADGETRAGITDMILGLKIAGGSGAFTASVLPFASFPTGSSDASTGGIDAGAGFNFQLNATGAFAIGWNAIIAFAGVEGRPRRILDFGAGLSAGYGFTERFGAFVEGYIQYTDGGDVSPSAAGGVTYLISKTVQLDLSGGTGLTGQAEGPYAVTGVALLL
jgi:hypothetical protein